MNADLYISLSSMWNRGYSESGKLQDKIFNQNFLHDLLFTIKLIPCVFFSFLGLPSRDFSNYDQVEDSWTDVPLGGQFPHRKNFFSKSNIWLCDFLSPWRFSDCERGWLLGLPCSCEAASQIASGKSSSWATSDFVLLYPSCSFLCRSPQRNRIGFWMMPAL